MSSKKSLVAIAATLFLAGAAQAQFLPIAYFVNRTVAVGSITGTIVTDGTISTPLQTFNFVDWDLLLSDGLGNTYNLTGPLSGNNSTVFVVGADVTASATELVFNFGGTDNGYFAFQAQGKFGSGDNYYCDAASANLGVCYAGETVVPATLATIQTVAHPASSVLGTVSGGAFFGGEVWLGSGVEYLQFPNKTAFGYYTLVASTIFYHYDMGYEALVAGSASDIYLYDFASGHWWYTGNTLFPYLYDFTLKTWIYYFPNTANPGRYTTNPRYFSNLTNGQIFAM